ncbi:MAG: hypothetical protein GC160_17130 [Acidobacteria bacterium]|nr:hypothetical protein [Acidobacteriota bacterium]
MLRTVLLCSSDPAVVRDFERALTLLPADEGVPRSQIVHAALDGLRAARELDGPVVLIDARLPSAGDLLRALREDVPDALPVALAAAWSEPLGSSLNGGGELQTLETPLDPVALGALLGASPQPRGARKNGRLLCFLGAQNGNGASTLSLHIAHALATKHERRSLLLELDFHSGALACRLGIRPEPTLAELSGVRAEAAPQRWRSIVGSWRGLDILLAPASSNALSARGLPPIDSLLASCLQEYDDVLADLPCSINASIRKVMAKADLVFLVSTPEITALHLASRRFQRLLAAGVEESRIRLVLNRTGGEPALDDGDVQRIVGIAPSFRLPNDYQAAAAAESAAELIAPDSALGAGLAGLASTLAGKKSRSSLRRGLEWFFTGKRS